MTASKMALAAFAVLMTASVAHAGQVSVQTVQYRDDRGYDRGRDDRGRDDRGREDRGREDRGREDRRDYGRQGGVGGSFQQSCREVRMDGPMLSAVCNDGRGRRVETSIDTSRCGRSDIGNNGGILQCSGARGSGRRIE